MSFNELPTLRNMNTIIAVTFGRAGEVNLKSWLSVAGNDSVDSHRSQALAKAAQRKIQMKL